MTSSSELDLDGIREAVPDLTTSLNKECLSLLCVTSKEHPFP